MMLEDVLEDPRPPWGRAFAAGFGAAALVALLVEVGPDVADAPDWWGFTTVAAVPLSALAFRVGGGASWRVALRGAALLVLVFGAGLGLALVADATDTALLFVGAAIVAGLVLSVAFRGRREPLPHVPAEGALAEQVLPRPEAAPASLPRPVEPLPAPEDDAAVALEKIWLDTEREAVAGAEPSAPERDDGERVTRMGHQRGWFDEDGEVRTGQTPTVGDPEAGR